MVYVLLCNNEMCHFRDWDYNIRPVTLSRAQCHDVMNHIMSTMVHTMDGKCILYRNKKNHLCCIINGSDNDLHVSINLSLESSWVCLSTISVTSSNPKQLIDFQPITNKNSRFKTAGQWEASNIWRWTCVNLCFLQVWLVSKPSICPFTNDELGYFNAGNTSILFNKVLEEVCPSYNCSPG